MISWTLDGSGIEAAEFAGAAVAIAIGAEVVLPVGVLVGGIEFAQPIAPDRVVGGVDAVVVIVVAGTGLHEVVLPIGVLIGGVERARPLRQTV